MDLGVLFMLRYVMATLPLTSRHALNALAFRYENEKHKFCYVMQGFYDLLEIQEYKN
uniref:Uncharacterized protein n=1 Tax=Anguilla anguilla TaxID=7936 RepID=A0A0E9PDK2_ANGAN